MQTRYSVGACCALFGLTAALFVSGTAAAQTNSAAGDTILIKGVLASAAGPLARKAVIVMPLNAQGSPVTLQSGAEATLRMDATKKANAVKWTYTYHIIGDPGLGPRLNPETKTDAQGAFSVKVRRDLLKSYRAGELALGVFTESGVSSFAPEFIKYDESSALINVHRLVFKPIPDPEKK